MSPRTSASLAGTEAGGMPIAMGAICRAFMACGAARLSSLGARLALPDLYSLALGSAIQVYLVHPSGRVPKLDSIGSGFPPGYKHDRKAWRTDHRDYTSMVACEVWHGCSKVRTLEHADRTYVFAAASHSVLGVLGRLSAHPFGDHASPTEFMGCRFDL